MIDTEKPLKFPQGFLWGSATSAHQVDGGILNNNWIEWEQLEGKIKNGEKVGLACDHWNRYDEDFGILKQLHQNAYRFSLEWSRIMPQKGEIDEVVIDHYHKMIAALKNRDIEPFVTIHHFTEPLWFTRMGGLNQKDNLPFFKEYVAVIAQEFSKTVTYWTTINEPNIRTVLGYFQGIHPPGETGIVNYVKAIRNLLRMHTEAYKILKVQKESNIVGLVKNIMLFDPYKEKSWFDRSLAKFFDYCFNEITIQALKTGKLPLTLLGQYNGLKESSDFIGLNYYTRQFCSRRFPEFMRAYSDNAEPSRLCTGLGWEAYPEGLYLCLNRLWRQLNLPIIITENGIGTDNDKWRQEFLLHHVSQVHRAIREGIPVKGYFHWSFIDNFEWAEGYTPHFGLVSCHRKTQERTIKESGYLYAKIAQENALPTNHPLKARTPNKR